jgi:hypothetical protein
MLKEGSRLKMAKIPGDKYKLIEVSRRLVLGDYKNSKQINSAELNYLNSMGIEGTKEEIKKLSEYDRSTILSSIFSSKEVASSGLSFCEAFKENPTAGILNNYALSEVNAEFTLKGIVRDCRTEELIQRLIALVSGRKLNSVLNEKKLINFSEPEPGDAETLTVNMNGLSLGKISFLLGLLWPPSERVPAIFLGMDRGQPLKPDNLVFDRLNRTIEIPKLFQVSIINIEEIIGVKIVYADTHKEIFWQDKTKYNLIRNEAQNFARTI